MSTLLDQRKAVTVTDDVAALLVNDMQKRFPQWSGDFCRRGVDQMVAYLAACAVAAESLAPSATVDEFWHAFIIRTVPYAEFCERLAGRFIHHMPDDDREHDPRVPGYAETMRARTVAAIEAAGHRVDIEFWPAASLGECTQCYQGCHDSPK